jgi:hypothetical protein
MGERIKSQIVRSGSFIYLLSPIVPLFSPEYPL